MDKVQKIREEVERLMYGFNLEADIASCEDAETEKLSNIKYQLCKKILDYIDEVQKEPVSEDLEESASMYAKEEYNRKSSATLPDRCKGCYTPLMYAFKAGANWQKEQDIKHGYVTFLQGEKRFANYILEMINNGWHIVAIKTACNDKIKED